jgi:signal transduction histidine kinase/ActR/RegA family two-component response regulator
MGALVIAPPLLTARATQDGPRRSRLEIGGFLAVLLTVVAGIFTLPSGTQEHQLQYLAFPVVVWAGLRFRPRGTAWAVALLSAAAVGGALLGRGPFGEGDPTARLLVLQSYVAIVALTGLVLAAVAAQAQDSMRERDLLLVGAEAARHGIEDANRRLSFLGEASAMLGASIDYETTLKSLARLAVPELADWCIVDVVDVRGDLRRVAVSAVQSEKEAVLHELQRRYPAQWDSPSPASQALRSGRTVHYPEFTREQLTATVRDQLHLSLIQSLDPRSTIAAPMIARGHTVGAITLAFAESGRRYDAEDVVTAEELARRAALAVDNARLYADAQEASRLKDQFLSILSHELRTPLNAIVGWSDILHAGVDAETARHAVDVIRRNASTQTQLISDILDIQRIVSGKLQLNMRSVGLGAIVDAVVDTLTPAAQAKQIEIRKPGPSDGDVVHGDPDRLQQIAWNLLSNAIKFTPKGGWVEVILSRRVDALELIVQDSGPGMDPGFIPYAFDRFRQADSGAARHHAGLGLGLAIARDLTALHGGEVSAGNREGGRGAIFTVRLPRLPNGVLETQAEIPAAAEARTDGVLRPSLAGVKVLVVDDEPDSLEYVSTALARHGAIVTAASSAREGMLRLEQEHPDVLLSDIEMPSESGLLFMQRVRALPPERGGLTPAAALTAYAGMQDRLRVLAAGFDTHVAKPVQAQDLAAAVASLAGIARNRA